MQKHSCPVCNNEETRWFSRVGGYDYFECTGCDLLFIDPKVLRQMDEGRFLVQYTSNYWQEELKAARERSWSTTLARVAEVLLYARIPIRRFIDIRSGPGYLLDAINYHLPDAHEVFHAAELFPPDEAHCTKNRNFHRGSLLDLPFSFEAGSCIEVLEHLTPGMAKGIFADIASKSVPNSIFIFNTGLSAFVKNEDPGYLDPLVRGRVVSWSVPAIRHLAEPLGFSIYEIPGKSWAFIAEYKPDHGFDKPIDERMWWPVPENKLLLNDSQTGNLMYILGMETIRAYKPAPPVQEMETQTIN